ncbi:hypothetical protein GCM10010466_35250 [Planomonospora alba]|uniref:Uncharacterized protein n=1 Tax=Planomonospora alba TaxID=161354 RepID=A0ABP6N9Z9_9ACTN
MTGYNRERFPRRAAQGNGCDTRETVLARHSQGVQRDTACRPLAAPALRPPARMRAGERLRLDGRDRGLRRVPVRSLARPCRQRARISPRPPGTAGVHRKQAVSARRR